MPKETITVMTKTELITPASKHIYFTLTDETERKLLSFVTELYPYLIVGSLAAIEVQPGKQEGDTPRILNVYKDGKPVYEAKPQQGAGRSYGKSKEELAQIRQLAEAQNRSIQAQTSLNRAVDIAIAFKWDKIEDKETIKQLAREFYQLLQSLTQISEADVIHKAIKEAKSESNIPRKTERFQDIPSIKDRGEDKQHSGEETGKPRADDTGGDEDPRERIKKLYQQRGMWQEGKGWTYHLVTTHIKGITGKMDIKQLTDTELTNVESDLIAQIKIMGASK